MDAGKIVREFIIENFLFGNSARLPDDAVSFLDNGMIDSTGVLEIIAFLEERFDISIEDSEITPENLDSVSRISAFVAQKTEASCRS